MDQSHGLSAAGDERFDWESLVPRLLHPIQVAIIEAAHWIDLPLAPSELRLVLGGGFTVSHLAYHVERLVRIDVLAKVGEEQLGGMTKSYYCLVSVGRR